MNNIADTTAIIHSIYKEIITLVIARVHNKVLLVIYIYFQYGYQLSMIHTMSHFIYAAVSLCSQDISSGSGQLHCLDHSHNIILTTRDKTVISEGFPSPAMQLAKKQ